MAINFPNDPSTNPGNGGQWTDPGGSGTWEVELINGEAIWTLVSTEGGGGGGGAVSLNELNDVTLSNPQDTNVLQYNTATGQWINAPAPAAANVNLNDLGDVNTTAGTTGDILVKQSNGNWEAKTPANNAGIGEAPEDGTPYVRQDAAWISMPDNGGGATLNIDEAPADGQAYTRKNNAWVPGVESTSGSTAQIEGDNNIDTGTNTRAVTTGHVLTYDGSKFSPAALPADNVGIGEAPNDGKQYARQSEAWAEVVTAGGGPADTDSLPEGSTNKYFPEAPNDGKQYARQSEGWSEVVASGGGGGDVEEAPEDGSLYARRDAEWVNLEQAGGLAYGKLSTSGLDAVTNFDSTAAATAAGFTQVTLGGDADDGNTAVQLPAGWTNTAWFGVKDPDTDTAGYQTLWVNGNGFASFMPAANATQGISSNSYPNFYGYDPVFSFMEAQNLLFGFHNMDSVLDMICTKEVGDNFVIHIQWKDEYGYYFDTVGGAALSGYTLPYNEYDPLYDPSIEAFKKRAKPKTAATILFTGELWLNKNGSVRMAYGPSASAISMVEESVASGSSQQTSGIYKLGVPVAEVMGTAIDFKAFASDNLIYGLDQTNDGNNVSGPGDLLDWYIEYSQAAVPFVTEAPEDGKTYGRKDGQWVEAAAGGGDGGGGAGSGSGTPDYYAPQSRRMAQGFMPGFSERTAINFETPIVRPAEVVTTVFANYQPGVGPFGDTGTFNLQSDNIIYIAKEDEFGVQPFGFVLDASDLLLLSEQYAAQEEVTDTNGNVSNILFIFATARFWRQFPGEAEEWKYVSVDFHIPFDYSVNVTAASGYLGLKMPDALFGTEADECADFYDLIGCTQAELEGTHIPDTVPDVIANSSDPQVGVLELYTRATNTNTAEGGGGGAPAKYSVGGGIELNSAAGIRVEDGCIPVWREDPIFTQNLGGDGGGGGAPARSLKDKPTKEESFAQASVKAKAYIAENGISPALSDGIPKLKKNPGGLGHQIPGYSETTGDPRKLFGRTVNCQAPRAEGSLQYDKLGLWDLYQVDPFLKGEVPAAGDTLVWDDVNEVWTLASFLAFKAAKPQVEQLIAAIQEDPELKAALKAALSD